MIPMLITAFLVLGADHATKHLACTLLGAADVQAIPGLLTLRLSRNDGIALGLLSGNRAALVLMPLAIVLVGAFMLHRYRATGYIRFASGLILGGFAGNYIERLVRGFVVDMIYFPFMPWFVCNVADIAICLGVVLMVISLLFRPQDWREKHAKDGDHSPQ